MSKSDIDTPALLLDIALAEQNLATMAAALSAPSTREGLALDALVDVNAGRARPGVDPGEPALAPPRRVQELRGLRFRGLQGYEGHLQHISPEEERAEACHAAMRKLGE